jgi:hypothetical protein
LFDLIIFNKLILYMDKYNEIKINKSYIKSEEEFYQHIEKNGITLDNVGIFKLVKNYLNTDEFNKIIKNNFNNFKNLTFLNL